MSFIDDLVINRDQLKKVLRAYDCHGSRISDSAICIYGLIDAQIVRPDPDPKERWQVTYIVLEMLEKMGFIAHNEDMYFYHITADGMQFAEIQPAVILPRNDYIGPDGVAMDKAEKPEKKDG